jgi:ribosomal protein S18 acetylase RimI-like enzyme
MTVTVRPAGPGDEEFRRSLLETNWHGLGITAKGRIYDVPSLAGFVAEVDGTPTGYLGYDVSDEGLGVIVVDAGTPGKGIGAALMTAAFDEARRRGLPAVWLTTSNENLAALKFYLRLGMRLVAVHLGAVDDARRRLKPSIPTHDNGIAVRDEWELRLDLRDVDSESVG